jgi:hypothetical protein
MVDEMGIQGSLLYSWGNCRFTGKDVDRCGSHRDASKSYLFYYFAMICFAFL